MSNDHNDDITVSMFLNKKKHYQYYRVCLLRHVPGSRMPPRDSLLDMKAIYIYIYIYIYIHRLISDPKKYFSTTSLFIIHIYCCIRTSIHNFNFTSVITNFLPLYYK